MTSLITTANKMTTAQSDSGSRRDRVLLGDLPNDFLRVDDSNRQIEADRQTAAMLQAQQQGFSFVSTNQARLSITIAQAKLNKNYGLVKMDLYCRLRVGHSVVETPTAQGSGKNPRWNKTIHLQVPTGVDHIYVEIFDERAFTMDDRVAWGHVAIPERVFNGETTDDWYNLSGKLGEQKEGLLNLVLSYNKQASTPTPPTMYPAATPTVYQTGTSVYQQGAPVMVIQPGMPVYYPPQVVGGAPVTVVPPGGQPAPGGQPTQPRPAQVQITDDDIKQIKEVFPNTDEAVIKSILEANNGDKDATINSLLTMDS